MEDDHSQIEMRGRRLVKLFWAVTPRQRFVLYFFIRGWNAQDIAEHLGVKKRTIQIYMNQIKRKAEELRDNGKLEMEENHGHRRG